MVEIIAHRGARSLAPENTLAAAMAGFKAGAHSWETDVSLTKDNQLVLFHDNTLGRCTNGGDHPLSDYSLEQVLKLDAGSHFQQTDPFSTIAAGKVGARDLEGFRGEKIPTLDQGLALTRQLNWKVNLELKDHGTEPEKFFLAQKTLEAVERSEIDAHQVVISSFNHEWLEWVRTRTGQIKVQALVGDSMDKGLDFGDFSFEVYNVNAFMVTGPIMSMLKNKGKQVNLFTVNDPAMAKRFMEIGANGIITDFPQDIRT